MTYVKASVKKGKGSPGAPRVKNPNLILIFERDIKKFVERNGVRAVGSIELNANEKAVGIYCTPSTIGRPNSSSGDPGKEGVTDTLVGFHPGQSEAIDAFLQEALGEDFVIISSECDGVKQNLIHGTKCNPMILSWEKQDDNEGIGYNLTFTQSQRSRYLPMHYHGDLPALADPAAEESGSDSGSGGNGIG